MGKRSKKPAGKDSSRREFIQKSVATGTKVAAGLSFYATLLKATKAYAETLSFKLEQDENSKFILKLQDDAGQLDAKALWAGKGCYDCDKYGGPMEEPSQKKK